MSALPWVSSVLGCPTEFRLARPHNSFKSFSPYCSNVCIVSLENPDILIHIVTGKLELKLRQSYYKAHPKVFSTHKIFFSHSHSLWGRNTSVSENWQYYWSKKNERYPIIFSLRICFSCPEPKFNSAQSNVFGS